MENSGDVHAIARLLTMIREEYSCISGSSVPGSGDEKGWQRVDSFRFVAGITRRQIQYITDQIDSSDLFTKVTVMQVPPCSLHLSGMCISSSSNCKQVGSRR